MKAVVHVGLKPGVLDPQGRAIAKSLNDLGFGEVEDVRIGKVITLELGNSSEDRVREMCEKLLANTVIESYSIEVEAEN